MWTCARCTFEGNAPLHLMCGICATTRDELPDIPQTSQQNGNGDGDIPQPPFQSPLLQPKTIMSGAAPIIDPQIASIRSMHRKRYLDHKQASSEYQKDQVKVARTSIDALKHVDCDGDANQQAESSAEEGSSTFIKAMSFNAWFDDVHVKLRMDAFKREVQRLEPDVLMLQVQIIFFQRLISK